MSHLNFNEMLNPFVLSVSTILRVGSAVYFYMVLRRSLALVNVKNGLIMLRKLLLLSAVVMFVTAVVTIALSITRPFLEGSLFGLSTDLLTIVNGAGFFFLGYIQYKIQTFQYSPRQLDLHAKIAKLEKKENIQTENREVARIKVNADRRKATKDKNAKKNNKKN